MDLYSYSKEENVTYAFDNYLENLVLLKEIIIFIDEINGIQKRKDLTRHVKCYRNLTIDINRYFVTKYLY